MAELQAADVLVFRVPPYNFGIPAALNTCLDLACRPGLTLRYYHNSPHGLVKDKKAYLVFTSGQLTTLGEASLRAARATMQQLRPLAGARRNSLLSSGLSLPGPR